jgi:amino acid permease
VFFLVKILCEDINAQIMCSFCCCLLFLLFLLDVSLGMSVQEFQPLVQGESVTLWTREEHRTSTFRTFINVTKCFVGAASFELPMAVLQAGWLVALFSILILAVISRYTLVQLTQCGHLAASLSSQKNSSPTYPQVGFQAFGWPGAVISYFGIAAMSLGVVGAYFVFMGATLSSLLIEYCNN